MPVRVQGRPVGPTQRLQSLLTSSSSFIVFIVVVFVGLLCFCTLFFFCNLLRACSVLQILGATRCEDGEDRLTELRGMEDEAVEMGQQPMAGGSTQILIDKLAEVARAATKVVVEHEYFQQLSEFLESIKQIAVHFQDDGDSSLVPEEHVQALLQDLDEAQKLITFCTNKSRIYLLLHCRLVSRKLEDVTHSMGQTLFAIPLSSLQGNEEYKALIYVLPQDMTEKQFPFKENEARLCQTLEPEQDSIRSDVGVQTGVLMDIARTAGIEDLSRNWTAFKNEIELLRKDVEESKEANDTRLLSVVSGMFDKWLLSNEQSSQSEDNPAVHPYHKPLELLYEAFVCPMTKQVMHDPVTLENGQTYERSAIERWFQECRDKGRPTVCPMTGQEVDTTVKPSLALRNTIEEWTGRNEQARIELARQLLVATTSEEDVIFALNDLQALCKKNKLNKYRVRTAGLIPLILDCLKNGEEVRCLALSTLCLLAQEDDDNKDAIGATDLSRVVKCLSRELSKEREEAVHLLFELSKSYKLCEKIGATNGAILILVGMLSSNSENVVAVQHADYALTNLEYCDTNVKQLAEVGRLQPLLRRLVEGSEVVRIEMAEDLAYVPLTNDDKSRAAQTVARALIEMLGCGNPLARGAALKALYSLSSLDSNGKFLIEAGVLSPLMRDLFVVGTTQVSTKQKEVSASVLANVVCSGGNWEHTPIDDSGNTLASELIVHNLLHMISNTGPAIEAKLLQVFVGLASSTRVISRIVQYIRSAGATITLIQFVEAPQQDLRVASIKLLRLLAPYMDQELADGLRVTTRQLGTLLKLLGSDSPMEEQAAAAGLLSNLPMKDIQLTRAMLDEGALTLLIRRLNDLKKGVVRIGDSRYMAPFQTGLVGILARFTYALDDHRVLVLAIEHKLTDLFTSILQSVGLDDVQRSAALALEHLSTKSKQLSELPELPQSKGVLMDWFACVKRPTLSVGLCPLHGGVCSSTNTFCLLSANAVVPLVSCLDHRNPGVVEAALGALSTFLMDTVDLERGAQVLEGAGAIQPILVIMQEHRTELLRQQAVWMVERILRNADLAQLISGDASIHTALVDAFRHGNYDAKQFAEKALKHLNRIPSFSGVFSKVVK